MFAFINFKNIYAKYFNTTQKRVNLTPNVHKYRKPQKLKMWLLAKQEIKTVKGITEYYKQELLTDAAKNKAKRI